MKITFENSKIHLIDLSLVKQKLCLPIPDGKGWSKSQCDTVEQRYKRYLWLATNELCQIAVPSRDIDEMWHAHILDTAAYEADCQMAFGKFIHHYPYFGLRGSGDRDRHMAAIEATSKAYLLAFGEQYNLEADTRCSSCPCSYPCKAGNDVFVGTLEAIHNFQ